MQESLEKKVLETEIHLFGDSLSHTDIELLVQREEVASLALSKFLDGSITFADYLDILETCEMSMDDYLGNVERNLLIVGVNV